IGGSPSEKVEVLKAKWSAGRLLNWDLYRASITEQPILSLGRAKEQQNRCKRSSPYRLMHIYLPRCRIRISRKFSMPLSTRYPNPYLYINRLVLIAGARPRGVYKYRNTHFQLQA